MNKLTGTIICIESSKHMSIVDIDVQGELFCAIVLETPHTASYLQKGKSIKVLFKETEVAIAKNLSGQISIRNRLGACVKAVERSDLLTKVILDYKGKEIISIISTRSADRLELKPLDQVEWLVKTNEVSLLGEKI